MDPNPKSFPILSYVMARLPSLGPKPNPIPTTYFDIEQPPPPPPEQQSQTSPEILSQMPRLTDPILIAAMTKAVSDVSQTRSVLQALGPRPDHESVDRARQRLDEIDSSLAKQLEEIVLSPRPADVDMMDWRAHLSDKEREVRDAAEREKSACKVVLQLEEMHEAYEVLLRDAEDRLVKIYNKASRGGEGIEIEKEEGGVGVGEEDIVSEEVVGILKEASGNALERVDLDNRKLRLLPEAFGRIPGLRVLNLSNNLLQVRSFFFGSFACLEVLVVLVRNGYLIRNTFFDSIDGPKR